MYESMWDRQKRLSKIPMTQEQYEILDDLKVYAGYEMHTTPGNLTFYEADSLMDKLGGVGYRSRRSKNHQHYADKQAQLEILREIQRHLKED